MHTILFLTVDLLQAGSSDLFSVQTGLQGLYDEISQASLQFLTESDVDTFHDVLFTPDWVLVDATGQRRTGAQEREEDRAEPCPPLPWRRGHRGR